MIGDVADTSHGADHEMALDTRCNMPDDPRRLPDRRRGRSRGWGGGGMLRGCLAGAGGSLALMAAGWLGW